MVRPGPGRFLLKKILCLGGLNFYQVALQLVLVPFYLKFFGLDGYGIIGFYAALLGVAAVLDTAISSAVCREIAWLQARGEEARRIPALVFSTEIAFGVLVGCLSAGFFLLASFFADDWFRGTGRLAGQIREIAWLAAGAFLTSFPAGFYNGILNGHQKQVRAGLLGALAQSIRGLGGVAVLAWVAADLRLFFFWNLLAGIFSTALLRQAALSCLHLPQGRPGFSWKAVESIRGFAGGMFAITACSSLSVYADRLILGKFVPLTEYGLYILISTVVSGLSRLVTPLTIYFSPLMTSHASAANRTQLLKNLQDFCGWISFLLVPPLVFFALFSDTLLALWTGNSHPVSGTQNLALLLGAGLLLSSACYPVTTMLYAKAEIAGILRGSVAMAVFTPLLLILIIPRYGIFGAATVLAVLALAHFAYILILGTATIQSSIFFLARNLCLSLGVTFFLPYLGWSFLKETCPQPGLLVLLFSLSFLGNSLLVWVLNFRRQGVWA